MDGVFIAERDCPATRSIRRPGDPGGVRLTPGESYRLLGRNRSDATHYQLQVPGAEPAERWVAVGCGHLGSESSRSGHDAVSGGPPMGPTGISPSGPSMAGQYVLAVTWQAAFCERRERLPECRGQTPRRADAGRFSLHGLWPQPMGKVYCGVGKRERALSESGDWRRLPAPDLDGPTRERLAERMPGTLSHLDRHQWAKHGTCFGSDAQTYFVRSMELLDRLNESAVQALFESSVGIRLRAGEVRQAFDRAFGAGAGERIRLVCDDQGLITELRIGLKGPMGPGSALGELIRAAPPRSSGCRGGWVDRAGPGR